MMTGVIATSASGGLMYRGVHWMLRGARHGGAVADRNKT